MGHVDTDSISKCKNGREMGFWAVRFCFFSDRYLALHCEMMVPAERWRKGANRDFVTGDGRYDNMII